MNERPNRGNITLSCEQLRGNDHMKKLTIILSLALASVMNAQTLTDFTLINADTNQPVTGYDPMPEGAVIATFTRRSLERPKVSLAPLTSTAQSARWG